MSGNRRRFFQDAAFFSAGFFGLTEASRSNPNPQASDPKTARAIEQGRHHSPYGDHKKKKRPFPLAPIPICAWPLLTFPTCRMKWSAP